MTLHRNFSFCFYSLPIHQPLKHVQSLLASVVGHRVGAYPRHCCRMAGYTLNRPPVYHRATQPHTLTRDSLVIIQPTKHVLFELWVKGGVPGEIKTKNILFFYSFETSLSEIASLSLVFLICTFSFSVLYFFIFVSPTFLQGECTLFNMLLKCLSSRFSILVFAVKDLWMGRIM